MSESLILSDCLSSLALNTFSIQVNDMRHLLVYREPTSQHVFIVHVSVVTEEAPHESQPPDNPSAAGECAAQPSEPSSATTTPSPTSLGGRRSSLGSMRPRSTTSEGPLGEMASMTPLPTVAVDPSQLPVRTVGSKGPQPLETYIRLQMFGIHEPGADICIGFVSEFSSRLEAITVNVLSSMFKMTSRMKLLEQDIGFLIPANRRPNHRIRIPVPDFVSSQHAFAMYLRQHLLVYLQACYLGRAERGACVPGTLSSAPR